MNDINQLNSGERLSFYKLFEVNNYKIEIPIIQRDYAQGRHTNSDIRDSFLEALKAYLEEGVPNSDLDFIYGTLLNGKGEDTSRFIPLDGQQRLTTLFLLHWYAAIKDNQLQEFRNVFSEQSGEQSWKSKFSYETRTSSREFFDALVSATISLNDLLTSDEGKNNRLSKTIIDQNWYYLSWEHDSTIQGVLVMLDAIHAKFFDFNNLYEKLIKTKDPIITFQFLELQEFGLTDDLYIKMNARGKPLTSFENFKAKLEQQLGENEFHHIKKSISHNGSESKVSLQDYFSNKMDTEWANLFWAYQKPKNENEPIEKDRSSLSMDDFIMNFLKTYAINYIAGKSNSEVGVRELLKTDSKSLSYLQFKDCQCFDSISIPDLITLLDLLSDGDNKAKQFIPEYFYYYDEDILERFLENDFDKAGYTERVQFHAYCQYLISHGNENEFGDLEGIEKWMRVIFNLSENTAPYNNVREFTNSIKGINAILADGLPIHDYLIKNKPINGFDSTQINEERLKAFLIEKSDVWQMLIYEAEQHGYYEGQIGFLLRLSGAEKYFEEYKQCNWSEEEDKHFQNEFISYLEIANSIFNEQGLKNDLSKNGDYIWERALLAKQDYLISEGRNQSFLINNDRDISWKRLLKGDKDDSHSELVKEIFDSIELKQIKASLNAMIDTYQNNDWKRKFIDHPKLFEYLGPKRYIRDESDHGFVLFKKERMSGEHAELHSYSFYLNNLQNQLMPPFTNSAYKAPYGKDITDFPSAYLDGWGETDFRFEIRYIDNMYELIFSDKESGKINNDVKEILKQSGMTESIRGNNGSLSKEVSNESEAIEFLKTTCAELKQITF